MVISASPALRRGTPHLPAPAVTVPPSGTTWGRGKGRGKVRKLLTEFRDFAFSGNLVDLAIGLAIGVAFGEVVQSLVDNIIMPLVAAIFGQPSFDNLVVTVNGTDIYYGAFLTKFVGFLLLALTILMLVKAIRKLTKIEAAGAQGNRECPYCMTFIPVDASVCMACTRDVVPTVSD